MYITIKYPTENIRNIIDVSDISSINRSSVKKDAVIIIFKKGINKEILFKDAEEVQFFLKECHEILQSNYIKSPPSEEIRESENLTGE